MAATAYDVTSDQTPRNLYTIYLFILSFLFPRPLTSSSRCPVGPQLGEQQRRVEAVR
jgi:hypothetical protein